MSSRDDRAYFASRAEQERARASSCKDNAAAMAHYQLADEYERRLRQFIGDQRRG